MILDSYGNPIRMDAPRVQWFRFGRSADEAGGERRFEAADTDRLNKAHWSNVADQSINDDLSDRWATIGARADYEAANNSMVEGMISTHVTDIVGPDGPILQVMGATNARGRRYVAELEAAWRDWWLTPACDVNEQLAGPDFLEVWIRLLWTRGEFLNQLMTAGSGMVRLRINALHPRQLATPLDRANDSSVVMGIKRTKTGKPLTYYVTPSDDTTGLTANPIAARNVLHVFKMREPSQARGLPWLAPSLQSIADLRDYDAEVLDAARLATDWAVALTTNHPDSTYLQVNETAEIQRRSYATMPPGWTVTPLVPPQPSTNYVEYRTERHRDFGRPVQMPAMMTRLDSQNHNYSSARFDGQLYQRANRATQAWLERLTLNRIVNTVAREIELARNLQRPAGLSYKWTWPAPPHVDPVKEATAEKIRLANRTLSLSDALADRGVDFEKHLEQLKREAEALKAAGLAVQPTGADQRQAVALLIREMAREMLPAAIEAVALERAGGNGAGDNGNGNGTRRLTHV